MGATDSCAVGSVFLTTYPPYPGGAILLLYGWAFNQEAQSISKVVVAHGRMRRAPNKQTAGMSEYVVLGDVRSNSAPPYACVRRTVQSESYSNNAKAGTTEHTVNAPARSRGQ